MVPEKGIVLGGCNSGHLLIWRLNMTEIPTVDHIAMIYPHTRPITMIYDSPDQRYIATASSDGTCLIFETPTHENINDLVEKFKHERDKKDLKSLIESQIIYTIKVSDSVNAKKTQVDSLCWSKFGTYLIVGLGADVNNV